MQPGTYTVNYRGLTFRELWRLGGGPVGFTVGLFLKFRKFKSGELYLPSSKYQVPCSASELSEQAQEQLQPHVADAMNLGYNHGTWFKVPKTSDCLDSGAYLALNLMTNKSIFIGYTKNKIDVAGEVSIQEATAISGSIEWTDKRSTLFVNHHTYLDDPFVDPVHVSGTRVIDIDRAMSEHMTKSSRRVVQFSSLETYLVEMDRSNDASEERKIARGVYELLKPSNE